MESGFLALLTRFVDESLSRLFLWAGGEGHLCLLPNLAILTHPALLCLVSAWSRPTQVTDLETGSPFSSYEGGSRGLDEDPITGHGQLHVLHSCFLNL